MIFTQRNTKTTDGVFTENGSLSALSDGVTVREDDELLSLSTCEYSSTNGRLIVLARRSGA